MPNARARARRWAREYPGRWRAYEELYNRINPAAGSGRRGQSYAEALAEMRRDPRFRLYAAREGELLEQQVRATRRYEVQRESRRRREIREALERERQARIREAAALGTLVEGASRDPTDRTPPGYRTRRIDLEWTDPETERTMQRTIYAPLPEEIDELDMAHMVAQVVQDMDSPDRSELAADTFAAIMSGRAIVSLVD